MCSSLSKTSRVRHLNIGAGSGTAGNGQWTIFAEGRSGEQECGLLLLMSFVCCCGCWPRSTTTNTTQNQNQTSGSTDRNNNIHNDTSAVMSMSVTSETDAKNHLLPPRPAITVNNNSSNNNNTATSSEIPVESDPMSPIVPTAAVQGGAFPAVDRGHPYARVRQTRL